MQGGLFGAQTGGGGLFGGAGGGMPQTQGNGLFSSFGGGAQQAQPAVGNGIFGQQNGGGNGGGLFGGGGQGFGQQQQQPQGIMSGGLFGGGQQQQQQQPQQQQNGLFGGNGGGQQVSQFGGQPQQGAGMFGQQPQQQFTLGGQQQQQQQQQQQGGGLFGGGGMGQQQQGGLFGQTQQQATGGLFGGQQMGNVGGSSGGLFGGGQAVGGGGFGGIGQSAGLSTFGAAAAAAAANGGGLLGGGLNMGNNQGGLFGQASAATTAAAGGGNVFNPGKQFQPIKSANESLSAKPTEKNVVYSISNGMDTSITEISLIQRKLIKTGQLRPGVASGQGIMIGGTGLQQPAAGPFGGGGLFGAPQQQQQQQQQAAAVGGLFGGGASATGGLFGQPQQQQQQQQPVGGGLFGAQPQQQQQQGSGGLFGAQPQPAASGGLFGAAQNGGGLFGGAQTQITPAVGGGGLFGGSQPAAATATTAAGGSGGLFGAANPQVGGGLFGGASQPIGGGGLFGGASQPAATAPASGGLFGGVSQQQAGGGGQTGGLFGGQSATPSTQTGGLFGAAQPVQGGGLFGAGGASTQPVQGGLFGQTQQQSQPQQLAGGLFGGSGQQQQSSMTTQQFVSSIPNSGASMFPSQAEIQAACASRYPTLCAYLDACSDFDTRVKQFNHDGEDASMHFLLAPKQRFYDRSEEDGSYKSPHSYNHSQQLDSSSLYGYSKAKGVGNSGFNSVALRNGKGTNSSIRRLIQALSAENPSVTTAVKSAKLSQEGRSRMTSLSSRRDEGKIVRELLQSMDSYIEFMKRDSPTRIKILVKERYTFGDIKQKIINEHLDGVDEILVRNFRLLARLRGKAKPVALRDSDHVLKSNISFFDIDYIELIEKTSCAPSISVNDSHNNFKMLGGDDDAIGGSLAEFGGVPPARQIKLAAGFSCSPSERELAEMSVNEQLSAVNKLVIENEFARVAFDEPVDLRGVRDLTNLSFAESKISLESVPLADRFNRKCTITFKKFGLKQLQSGKSTAQVESLVKRLVDQLHIELVEPYDVHRTRLVFRQQSFGV